MGFISSATEHNSKFSQLTNSRFFPSSNRRWVFSLNYSPLASCSLYGRPCLHLWYVKFITKLIDVYSQNASPVKRNKQTVLLLKLENDLRLGSLVLSYSKWIRIIVCTKAGNCHLIRDPASFKTKSGFLRDINFHLWSTMSGQLYQWLTSKSPSTWTLSRKYSQNRPRLRILPTPVDDKLAFWFKISFHLLCRRHCMPVSNPSYIKRLRDKLQKKTNFKKASRFFWKASDSRTRPVSLLGVEKVLCFQKVEKHSESNSRLSFCGLPFKCLYWMSIVAEMFNLVCRIYHTKQRKYIVSYRSTYLFFLSWLDSLRKNCPI